MLRTGHDNFNMHARKLKVDEKQKILYIKIHQVWYFIFILYPRTHRSNPGTSFYRKTR
jgi:hypothetical protein